jgi:hypothetical protein
MLLTRRDFLFGAIATAPVLQWSPVRGVAREAMSAGASAEVTLSNSLSRG